MNVINFYNKVKRNTRFLVPKGLLLKILILTWDFVVTLKP